MTIRSLEPARALPTELPANALRWHCDPAFFEKFRGQDDDHPRIMGQARAVEALRLGLSLESPGYNIFVCGPSGTGKRSTVRALLRERPGRGRPLRDFIYVNNFSDLDRPRLLVFPAGQARAFRRGVEAFVESLHEVIPHILEGAAVERKRKKCIAAFQSLERELVTDLEQRCRDERFQLTQVEVGDVQHLDIHPIYKKKPIDLDELNELAAGGKARVPKLAEINEKHVRLKEELRSVLARLRSAARQMRLEIENIETAAMRESLSDLIRDLTESFPFDGVFEWLEEAGTAVTDHLDVFREPEEPSQELSAQREDLLRRLNVHVVLDNSGRNDSPVVFENVPSFTNVLGTIERPSDDTRGTVDFNHIRAGSLLRADGGFLIINANDAVGESGVWRAMTRVLKTGSLEIQSPEQFMNPGGASALKPQPIDVDVKVIALGDDELYRALWAAGEDFQRAFKIKADFDDTMPLCDENLAVYAHLSSRVAREEGLTDVSDSALARLVEHAVRLAERQGELSTRFGSVTDLLREASHYAAQARAHEITADHVDEAIRGQAARHGLAEDRFHRLVAWGIVNIATSGTAVGEVNALTVIHVADHVFGQPCRIAATCTAGSEGVASIERESELSGQIHDKGTLIFTAYLRSHYLPDANLSMTATVAFEQMHDIVDGDSASAAEAIAILSVLADVPLRQSLAVTGAVDQRGRIAAVGGLNEKIEGFFRICRARGLDGSHGVVIPADNRDSLVLGDDLVAAVAADKFHVWPVDHIDEVIECLTGVCAGKRDAKGEFPEGTFNALAREGMIALAAVAEEARREKQRRRGPRGMIHDLGPSDVRGYTPSSRRERAAISEDIGSARNAEDGE